MTDIFSLDIFFSNRLLIVQLFCDAEQKPSHAIVTKNTHRRALCGVWKSCIFTLSPFEFLSISCKDVFRSTFESYVQRKNSMQLKILSDFKCERHKEICPICRFEMLAFGRASQISPSHHFSTLLRRSGPFQCHFNSGFARP